MSTAPTQAELLQATLLVDHDRTSPVLAEELSRCKLRSLLAEKKIGAVIESGQIYVRNTKAKNKNDGWIIRDATPDGKTIVIEGVGAESQKLNQAAVYKMLLRELKITRGELDKHLIVTAEWLEKNKAKLAKEKKKAEKEAKAKATAEEAKANAAKVGKISLRARRYAVKPYNNWRESWAIANLADDVVSHLHEQKSDTSKPENVELYWANGVLCAITRDGDNAAIAPLNEKTLLKHLGDVTHWTQIGDGADCRPQTINPPNEVWGRILACEVELPFAPLQRVAFAPFFSSEGVLVQTGGYHPQAGAYLHLPAAGLNVPPVSETPTPAEVRYARMLLKDILRDFPAHDEGDDKNAGTRAHMLAHLIQPSCRDLIDGSAPMFAIFKRAPGDGASKFLDICSLVNTGELATMTPSPKGTEDEMGKVLHGLLMEGASAIAFDNQPTGEKLDSGALASAITAGFIRRRVLGSPKTATAQLHAVVSVNGNGLEVSSELARRVLPIFFNTGMPDPTQRTDFKYADLEAHVLANRGRLVWACLTLVANWLAKGRPPFSGKVLPSFEAYSRVMGGILEAAGIDGFLANRSLIAETDTSSVAMKAFIDAWWQRFGLEWVTVGKEPATDLSAPAPDLVTLYSLCSKDIDLGFKSYDRQNWGRMLGRKLSPHVTSTFDNGGGASVRINRREVAVGTQYSLELV